MMPVGSVYFGRLAAALRQAGVHRPALVVDRDRLDANIAAVLATTHGGPALRLVDKSLPSIALLGHLRDRLKTHRVMTFHVPVARAVLSAFADAELLFGKPMPIGALDRAFQQMSSGEAAAFSARVVWLVDNMERLSDYADFARSRGLPLTIALEVDIGMGRGGFAAPGAVGAALRRLEGEERLRCAGIMGYEAHIPHVPLLFGGPAAARRDADRRFAAFADCLARDQRRILNTAGSKTALGYRAGSVANELSIGSAFLKPTDFDVPDLSQLAPALFIATPVLKVLQPRLPGPDCLSRVLQAFGAFPKKGCFLYGGKFMARPEHPPGMRRNRLWGDSSNQQFMALPANTTLRPDDLVFFRPTQSEGVLQHYGPILVYADGRIEEEWATLPPG